MATKSYRFSIFGKSRFTFSKFSLTRKVLQVKTLYMQAVERSIASSAAPERQSHLVNAAFGRRLRSVRRSRRLSQTEFAEKAGVSRVTVVNLESGKQNVKLEQIFSFAALLDAPVERFIPTVGEIDAAHVFTRVRTDNLSTTDFQFLETVHGLLRSTMTRDES